MSYNPLQRIQPDTDEALRKTAWEEACRIATWIQDRHPEAKVMAYGSLVRKGAWNPRSDIDLAVSGVPDFKYKLNMDIRDTFRAYEVQLINLEHLVAENADPPDERDPEAENFRAEVLGSGVEIPGTIPTAEGEPEILILPRRLESTLRRAEAEIAKMERSAAIAASDPEKARGELILHAVRWEAMRYRAHIERGLSRVLGYIDRLAIDPELDEAGERLRLYRVASVKIPGLRPALIAENVAAWHSKYIELEFALVDGAEEKEITAVHLRELPAIHLKTKLSFDAFGAFLRSFHEKPT